MLTERIEGKWIDAFAEVFTLCGVGPDDVCAVLSETQSRSVNVQMSELALQRLGARPFHVVVPTPRTRAPVPVRSTGASDALGGYDAAVRALAGAVLVVDCTVEGLLHAAELGAVLSEGARVLMVSDEHPEILERLVPSTDLEAKVKVGIKMLQAASEMRVTSRAGSDLTVDVSSAPAAGGWGYTTRPGSIAHWPGGLCLCFPGAGTVNGRLVMDSGDLNLTFKRYLETRVSLEIVDDHITAIEGDGPDADLFRTYLDAWGDREARATSHIGWGMNPAARWEALTMYDRSQLNGTEQRAFAGNLLYSTGANEVAGRHTLGHFDLPLRGCTVTLDGEPVVVEGILQGALA